MTWDYKHLPGCGLTAFRLTKLPVAGARIERDMLQHLKGGPILPGESMKCGSCGGYFSRLTVTNIERTPNEDR